MDSPIIISLVVSGIGMLTLFLALTLLCGLMYLMTALIQDRPGAGTGEQEAGSGKQQAAVIAVALARAERELSTIGAPGAPGEETVSAWRALHHQRKLTLNMPTRRAR